jgi:hypothetical protein
MRTRLNRLKADRMTVVPFIRPMPRNAHGVTIRPRRDLRTGVTAAGALREWTIEGDVLDALAVARTAWREAGHTAPLAIAPAFERLEDAASAGDLAAAIQLADISPRSVDIEVSEADLAGHSLAGIERLRARGFGVALAVDPDCPLPLGARARSLFTELLLPAPTRLDPFLGCEALDANPMARRLFAARECGLVVTAVGVGDHTWARALLAAGFDRGEGPFAPTY